jgi:amphiphysin
MTHATYSLLPHLLNSQVMIQNTLLAQLYTVLHGYCGDYGFGTSPPEADEIMRVFEADFTSLRLEVESGIMMLARGKAIAQPMGGSEKGKSYTGLNIRNGVQSKIAERRGTSQTKTSTLGRPHAAAIEERPPSPEATPPPAYNMVSRPKITSNGNSSFSKSSHALLSPDYGSPSSTTSPSQGDYFAPASHTSSFTPRRPSAQSLASSISLASIASKKKPPPPPPKRMPSQQFEYVTALYDFNGEGEGDLSFREGDRIRIVKKTGSVNDWWEGELRGSRGSFPANYCQ